MMYMWQVVTDVHADTTISFEGDDHARGTKRAADGDDEKPDAKTMKKLRRARCVRVGLLYDGLL